MYNRKSVLRQLMQSREDMLTITSLASTWMTLQDALFPMTSLTKTSAKCYLSTTNSRILILIWSILLLFFCPLQSRFSKRQITLPVRRKALRTHQYSSKRSHILSSVIYSYMILFPAL